MDEADVGKVDPSSRGTATQHLPRDLIGSAAKRRRPICSRIHCAALATQRRLFA